MMGRVRRFAMVPCINGYNLFIEAQTNIAKKSKSIHFLKLNFNILYVEKIAEVRCTDLSSWLCFGMNRFTNTSPILL